MLTWDAHYFSSVGSEGSYDIDELDKSDDGTSHTGCKPIVVQLSWG